MSHRTSATVVLDSITPYGNATRLTSIYVVFPRMVLAERNRHRAFSLSDRSSRAVPPEKLIAEVREDPAMPAKFRRRAKGMGGGEEFVGEELEIARRRWRLMSKSAATWAEVLINLDLAKEIVNRPLDPYIRVHSLMSATRDGWLNFFGLRLDEGADPTIQVLAQKCFEAYKASTPQLVQPGGWHLPFYDPDKDGELLFSADLGGDPFQWMIRLSAARCAHLSYNDLETGKRMTIERALKIYDKLVNSGALHASPMEHQARVDRDILYGMNSLVGRVFEHGTKRGNFAPGWIQFRKTFPDEAVAELPEGCVL